MMPLTALLLLVGTLTCIVIHNTLEMTADRVLVGSTRTLSLALDSPPDARPRVLDLAVQLLQRRARPQPYYSVYEGKRLVAGFAELAPPSDYRAPYTHLAQTHPAATFPVTYRDRKLHSGYVEPEHARSVVQPAYLYDGTFRGQPARIAAEIRRVAGFSTPLAIQVADYVTDRHAYQMTRYLQVIGGGVLILLTSVLLFWWAITWGLTPYAVMHSQVQEASREPPAHFRMTLPPDMPREAVPFVESFNRMMERTEQATESIRQFTANASHQMRTPLSILRVHLDVLHRLGPDSARGQQALRDIDAAVDTLERLLMQLIALERASQQSIDMDRAFDLADVTAEVVGGRYAVALNEGVELAYENDCDGRALAIGHAVLASELIGNLVDNAIRYNRPGGSVTARLARDGGIVRLEVEDDGPGIPPAERDKVFERFYRGPASAERMGSGLGLSIVRVLADRMGATVRLDNGPQGRGLRARVNFRAAS